MCEHWCKQLYFEAGIYEKNIQNFFPCLIKSSIKMERKHIAMIAGVIAAILLVVGLVLIFRKPMKKADKPGDEPAVDADKQKKHRMAGGVLIVLALIAGGVAFAVYKGKLFKGAAAPITAAESIESLEEFAF
jgi:hypothetical protein